MHMRKSPLESKFQSNKQNRIVNVFSYNVSISFKIVKGQDIYGTILGVLSELFVSINALRNILT